MHKGLEHFIETRDFKTSCELLQEYREENHPDAPRSFEFSIPKMLRGFRLQENYKGEWYTEIVFAKTVSIGGRDILFRGKLDALKEDDPEYGRRIGEHKCKGYTDPQQTKNELKDDLQLNIYCKLFDVEWVNYDLIKIPDTQKYGPPQSPYDSVEEWIEKLYCGPIGSYKGMYPINVNRFNWIHQGQPHFLPREGQEEYWDKTVTPIVKHLCTWYDYVTQSGFDHNDPKFYNELFFRAPVREFDGRRTEGFKCEYYSLLLGETTEDQLTPVTSHYSELEG